MIDKVNILGVEIDNISKDEALLRIDRLVKKRKPSLVVTPNVDVVMNLQKDEEYRQIYKNAALVLTDGVPLLWAGKFLGTPIREKISGSDIFYDICELASNKKYRIFFMGGREGAALKAAEIIRKKYHGINIVGIESPPFGFEKDENEMTRLKKILKKVKPDILFLGLGSPKQEKWFNSYSADLGIPVTMGIGITFEYASGFVKRAPNWMQRIGLEWFFRLMMEPKRLWKRYLLNDPKFFWLIFKQKIFK